MKDLAFALIAVVAIISTSTAYVFYEMNNELLVDCEKLLPRDQHCKIIAVKE